MLWHLSSPLPPWAPWTLPENPPRILAKEFIDPLNGGWCSALLSLTDNDHCLFIHYFEAKQHYIMRSHNGSIQSQNMENGDNVIWCMMLLFFGRKDCKNKHNILFISKNEKKVCLRALLASFFILFYNPDFPVTFIKLC